MGLRVGQVRVAAKGPFDHRAALEVLVAHTVAGFDLISGDTFVRLVEVDGVPRPVSITLDESGALVGSDDAAVAERVRYWFDLDTDLGPIIEHLAADPVFAADVVQRPGLRITRFPDPFAATCMTIVGQQVSLAAARLFTSRLVAALAEGELGGLRPFPSPRTIATTPVDDLRASIGLTNARAATLQATARLWADIAGEGRSPTRAELAGVKGIGPWTLDYLALRVADDPDSFPTADAVLKRRLRELGVDDPARVATWSPWRSYAASRLWSMPSSAVSVS